MAVMRHAPESCAAVTFDMKGKGYGDPAYDAGVGDLLWNPKGGEGHLLVAKVQCDGGRTADCGCGGWGSQPCPSTTLICQCGQDGSWRDHHYCVLARRQARDA